MRFYTDHGRYLKPPGPASGLITGTPGFSKHQPHLWYKELSKTYGNIFSVWNGTKLIIVLNSAEDIKELCDRVSDIISDDICMSSY